MKSGHAFISTLRGITALEFSFVWHLTTDECHLIVLHLWLWLYRNSISKMLAWVDLDNRQIHCFSLWRATHQWAKLLRPPIFLCSQSSCQPEKHKLTPYDLKIRPVCWDKQELFSFATFFSMLIWPKFQVVRSADVQIIPLNQRFRYQTALHPAYQIFSHECRGTPT